MCIQPKTLDTPSTMNYSPSSVQQYSAVQFHYYLSPPCIDRHQIVSTVNIWVLVVMQIHIFISLRQIPWSLGVGLLDCTVSQFSLFEDRRTVLFKWLRYSAFLSAVHESQFLHTLANKRFIVGSHTCEVTVHYLELSFLSWLVMLSAFSLNTINLVWKNVYSDSLPII